MQTEEQTKLYLAGDLISDQGNLISGTNTYEENGNIYASKIGYIKKTQKLVLIEPIKAAYEPQSGEIVIGRIVCIRDKKWVVNIGSTSEATLHLNSTYLPEQRQKTEEDEMRMREIFPEGSMICAEVHSINQDKSINLHTRGEKYGKLQNGAFFQLNHYLIQGQKKKFVKLSNNINLIIGHNGRLFISNQDRSQMNQKEIVCDKYSVQQRVDVAFTYRALKLLFRNQLKVSQAAIELVLQAMKSNQSESQIVERIIKAESS